MHDLDITFEEVEAELARRHLSYFSELIYPSNTLKHFHRVYYSVLDRFARRDIKNLIITIPPQHGKSEGSSRLLPAYILGLRPDERIAICSYSSPFAMKFNRSIQRIIDTKEYHSVFPETQLNRSNVVTVNDQWLRNSTEFEIVNHKGSLLAVGRGGPITGNPVDVLIFDDLYKDAKEGNSPLIRDSVIEWYESAPEKRRHNETQQLIVFTRWHEEDLIGYVESHENVVEAGSMKEIDAALEVDPDTWIKLNFEAIKESLPTEFDPRDYGRALWESKHSLKKHLQERKKNVHMFNCMNQGKPEGSEGLLYTREFETYKTLPPTIHRGNYTDTADQGEDYLFSVCFEIDSLGKKYVTDLLYTQDPMEVTEPATAEMLKKNNVKHAYIESNNGGRGFARNVEKMVKGSGCEIHWFHQSQNKESRIITNSSEVNKILFPDDWKERWPMFASHVTKYKRLYSANKFHDAPDGLTGIIEKSARIGYSIFL